MRKFKIKGTHNSEHEVIVSPEDVWLLECNKWFVDVRKNRPETSNKYVKCTSKIKFKTQRLHRIITGAKKGQIVDHINGNTLDNRRENLRITTSYKNALNTQNLRSTNKSGYTGVSWDNNSKKWDARVHYNKKSIRLGRFSCKHQAARRVNTARLLYHGLDVKLNVIKEAGK